MTSFSYDKEELIACAVQGECSELFEAYNRHYGRLQTPKDGHDDWDSRFQHFQSTARYVYQHNQIPNASFSLTLNQFSDQAMPATKAFTHPMDWEDLWKDDIENDDQDETNRRLEEGFLSSREMFTHLNEERILRQHQITLQGKHFKLKPGKKVKKRRKKKATTTVYTDDDVILRLGGDGIQPKHANDYKKRDASLFGHDVPLPSDARGSEVDVKADHTYSKDPNDKFATHLNWATSNNPDKVPLVHRVIDQGTCGSCWAFAATGSLEASATRRTAQEAYHEILTTQQPPKGWIPHEEGNHTSSPESVVDASLAKHWARQVESETFRLVNLSIQELLDCDTAADQGCIGGNPLLAFFFIHRYGLVPWDEYPYQGKKDDVCHLDRITHPIATVESWGILPKNHENMIELALRYIGPVAVGLNGADPSFVSYSGGIYNPPDCDQRGNHAMLIVGYGEEQVPTGHPDGSTRLVRYWIARNSWGRQWGEKGYVRVQRGPGGKKTPGICGIARSPSVALGGLFRPERTELPNEKELLDPTIVVHHDYSDATSTNATPTKAEPYDRFYQEEFVLCYKIAPPNSWSHMGCHKVIKAFHTHRALSLGVTSVIVALMFAAWPLSHVCRRHQRRKRRLQQARLDNTTGNPSADEEEGSLPVADERTPMLTSGEPESEKASRPYGSTEESPTRPAKLNIMSLPDRRQPSGQKGPYSKVAPRNSASRRA